MISYLAGVESTRVDIAAYEALRGEVDLLRSHLLAAEKRAADATERQAQLAYELAQLKRLIFGSRSERFVPETGPEQLPLFMSGQHGDGAPEATEVARVERRVEVVTRTPKQKPARQVLPSHLPRQVIVIEPDGETSHLKKIGEEVTETLDYHPAKLIVLRRVRPKYVDPKDEARGVIIGELPARPIDKGIAEPSLLAHVVIEKFVDHLPLYRQVQRFTRQGITMAESTLGGFVAATAELLVPLYEKMKEVARGSGYLQADETPIAVQDGETKGSTHRGYYWVFHAPLERLVVMDYHKGRDRDGPKQMLKGFAGALQSDGYAVYDGYDSVPGIVSYNCWAHARRYFFEAQENAPDRAKHVLGEIGRLYDLERVLREAAAAPEERRRRRQEEAVPVLEGLKVWLEGTPGLPKSPWGKAVSYALTRWAKLCRYVDDGRIEIDNNLIENAIRPVALGRKNYLFAGSHEAAQRAAVIYSLVATCKKHEVNPEAWLADVLGRIPTHPARQVAELLPHRWKNGKM